MNIPENKYYLIVFCFLFIQYNYGQQKQNNILRGKVLFLNSGKTEAVGVEISGRVTDQEIANITYSSEQGEYELKFPKERNGHRVFLKIGDKDEFKNSIETVNQRVIDNCRIPAIETDSFEIIVCKKGERDIIARRYYNIIKNSSELELEKLKKEYTHLVNQAEKNSNRIEELNKLMSIVKKEQDSLKWYKEAYRIASINKDNANIRVKKYIKYLEEGKSVQEALKVLNIEKAKYEVENGSNLTNAGIEEIESSAEGSLSVFNYENTISAYQVLISSIENNERTDPREIAYYYNKLGGVYILIGDYRLALDQQSKALKLMKETLFIDDHPFLSNFYINMAIINSAQSNFESSLEYYEKGVKSLKKGLQVDESNLDFHMSLAACYSGMSIVNNELSNYDLAFSYIQNSIELLKKHNPNNPTLAVYYNNKSLICKNIAETEEALKYLENAISILESNESLENSRRLYYFYNNKAELLRIKGNYEESIRITRGVINNIEGKFLDSLNPFVGVLYNNLGLTYSNQGNDLDSALKHMLKAKYIYQKTLSNNHPNLGSIYSNLATLYTLRKEFDKSLDLHDKAISIFKEHESINTIAEAAAYKNKALTLLKLGDNNKSISYYEKAVEVFELKVKSNNKDLVECYSYLGLLYEANKNYEKSIEYFQKSIDNYMTDNITGQKIILHTNKRIARLNLKLKNNSEALEYYLKSLKVQESIKTSNDSNLAELYAEISLCYNLLENKKIALSYMLKSVNIYEKTLSDGKILGEYYNFIGVLYFNISNYPKAIDFFQKAFKAKPEINTNGNYFNSIGQAFTKNGDFENAKSIFLEYEKIYPNKPKTYRNWALFYAVQNLKEKVFYNLEKAIKLGYKDIGWIKKEKAFDQLMNDKAFIKILERIK